VEDPREEQRRWRHRRAANRADGRIPTGAAEVEWAIEEPPQDQQAPGSHAKSVVAATLEYRRKCEARRRSEERRLKGRPEEDEQQLWENPEYPPTTRYAPEHCIPPPAVAEDWAPSPPRWLPEISPTPRYEVSPHWTPARKPTPRFEQSTPLSDNSSHNASEASSNNPIRRSNSQGTRWDNTSGRTYQRPTKEANLRLSPEKCQFFKKELLYLGHRVTSEGSHRRTRTTIDSKRAPTVPWRSIMVPLVCTCLRKNSQVSQRSATQGQ